MFECKRCGKKTNECYRAEGELFCSVKCKLAHINDMYDEITSEIEDCARLDTIDALEREKQRLEDTYDI